MKVNVLMEIRADFTWPADDPADDTALQAKNRETLALCGDITVIPNLYATRASGGNWQVYSLVYDMPTWPEIEAAVELFKSENPGQTGVLGAWDYGTGEQIVDDAVPVYPIPGYFSAYMPDDDPTIRDVNLYFGQTPRNFA